MAAIIYTKKDDHIEQIRPTVTIIVTPDNGKYRLSIPTTESNGDKASASSAFGRFKRWHYQGKLPILFERAAKTWWDPRFDSEILENQYWRTSFPQARKRFRFALIYILITVISWCIYFGFKAREYWLGLVIGCSAYASFISALLAFTFTPFYHSYHFPVSLATTLVTCAISLAVFLTAGPLGDDYDPEDGVGVAAGSDMSTIGMFVGAVEVIILIYTFIPMPLYICMIVTGVYSVSFETLSALYTRDNSVSAIVVKVLLHLCIHLIGVHILIMTQVRMHSTFLKVGQTVLVRRDLELEKKLKENIIHSLMPPKVAEWLMTEGPSEDEEIHDVDGTVRKLSSPRSSHSTGGELRSLFRPFNMNKIENVSILFADIVGFTKMSSNKTAEQLVDLLNDLFGRFDVLCEHHSCEKISTLGDCYYCVAGCPEPRPDHARCCVDMGLSMVDAIKQFDEDTNEDVNMRVGVHTGKVLCGIVGTKRFKFDVWSNDVTFANLMESSGMAGRVHISETTYKFIEDEYYVEEGELKNDLKTYFIIGRKRDFDGCSAQSNLTELQANAKTVLLPRGSKTSIKSHIIEEEVDLPGSLPDNQDSASPMLEHYVGYKESPSRDSWDTINSRKDSGIRSRESSIQAQHFRQLLESSDAKPADLLSHRVSGYYSNSQPSIMDPSLSLMLSAGGYESTQPICESFKTFRQLRKQSDKQLIRGLQQDDSHSEYFLHPPISKLSLFFVDKEIECEYRARVHRQDVYETTPTLASPSFNTYFDVVVSFVTYIITAFACFIMFGAHFIWIFFCFVFTSCQAVVAYLCFKQFLDPRGSSARMQHLYNRCTRWYPWHILGALLVSLPMMSILANFSCQTFVKYPLRTDFFFFIFFVSLIHFCNFTQLNCWMKSAIASIGVVTVLAMLESDVCSSVQAMMSKVKISNATTVRTIVTTPNGAASVNPVADFDNTPQVSFSGADTILYEVILDMLLLLVFLWFLNREFEISYRLCFHGGLLASLDHQKVQMLKDQADWLLNNIMPKSVAEHLKCNSKYSENHKDVGILFATIANFNELYDESYCGGKECLRVLNELISDFDELLYKSEFKNVEKIKTIGATFMAASGLNPQIRKENEHPYQHLLELMDFAFALLDVIENFNRDILEFNFVMRIGFNYGDVTAGIIGTTKLQWDLWGDSVNVASRMDSTGMEGFIQVPEHCVPIFQDYFVLRPRGTIFVKGKDNMNVFQVLSKKPGIGYQQQNSYSE